MNGFEFEDSENSPENSVDSLLPTMSSDAKVASTSSSKRSRRAIQKRVVSVPIKDLLRLKGDLMSSPPSDSWTWRKYGQKPIKGSPYPRGYYRCSSSKGCPARKQVERSKSDPNVIVVTYSYEHNHPWPSASSRNNHHHTRTAAAVTTPISEEEEEEEEEIDEEEEKKPVNISTNQPHEVALENKFPNFGDGSLINCGEFGGWFTDFESTVMLESPISTEDRIANDEMAMIFTMREEDDSLFADLGELPECSTVFRREVAQKEAAQPRRSLATTG